MKLFKRLFLPLVVVCALAFTSNEALAQNTVRNIGNCTWTIDYTTNLRVTTGAMMVAPGGVYAPVLGALETVVFIRIDGVNYNPPTFPNCVVIPPNNTCMSVAHQLCDSGVTGWTIN